MAVHSSSVAKAARAIMEKSRFRIAGQMGGVLTKDIGY